MSRRRTTAPLAATAAVAALSAALLTVPASPAAAIPLNPGASLRFDFGPGALAAGHTRVDRGTAFSSTTGFGFADTSRVTSTDRGGSDPLRADFATPRDTSFSVEVPSADYTVSLVAGDGAGATDVAVRAESVLKVPAAARTAGQFLETSFDVAVVDGRLDLEFSGATPNVNAVVVTRQAARTAGAKPTVYIAGDSTVQTYGSGWKPEAGWGQVLPHSFTTGVAFSNHAIGGRSSKSFLVEGRLDAVLRALRPGDYFYVQFGHNDATVSRPERYVTPEQYEEYLKRYVDGARQRGATPVLVTPVGRRSYDPATGRFNDSFGSYTRAMKEVGAELGATVLDLGAASRTYYEGVGPEGTKNVFLHTPPGAYPAWADGVQDDTHFQEYGAIQIARLLASLTRTSGLPLAQHLRTATPPAAARRFDFGPAGSPALTGYAAVTRADLHTPARGFGFTSTTGMIDRDRGEGTDAVRRDFVACFGCSYEFRADVPDGTYTVRTLHGDALGSARTSVRIEGVDRGSVAPAQGATAEKVVTGVVVSDGRLDVVLSGSTAHLNGLEVLPAG